MKMLEKFSKKANTNKQKVSKLNLVGLLSNIGCFTVDNIKTIKINR